MTHPKSNNKGRSHISTALIVLLALTRSVGIDAGALPFGRPAVATLNRKHEPACLANIKRKNGQCFIPRGGSSAAVAATSDPGTLAESMKILGITGAMVYFRDAFVSAAQNWWKDAETTRFLLAGAVAGIVSRTVVSPLEVVATAQMVRGGNKGLVGELSSLFQAEGIKGFFKGNGANCLKVAPTRGVQFFAFEKFKLQLVEWKRKSQGLAEDADVALTPLERLVAGGFAGMVASSMVYPIEVVKTMLTMYPGKYGGIVGAFRGVLAEVGFKGLYAGLTPTLIAMFPYVGVEFMIYETSKIAIEAFLTDNSEDGAAVALPIILSLGLGALAGAAAQSSAHPLDVVRKRLQVQGINGNPVLYKSTFDCFSRVANKEGLGALYRGLGPACVATIPGTGIAYITYEFMKNVLNLSSV
jgi:solute carrier family 25 phosphate transporter 23/24/25/41